MKPGTRYGRRVVLEHLGRDKKGRERVRVRCDCGRESVVQAHAIHKTSACRSCSGRRRYHRARLERSDRSVKPARCGCGAPMEVTFRGLPMCRSCLMAAS